MGLQKILEKTAESENLVDQKKLFNFDKGKKISKNEASFSDW